MSRTMLIDEQWTKLEKIMLENGIYSKPNLRKTVEGILYRIRVGCPWRDLPQVFGKWNTVFKRYNEWCAKAKFGKIFDALAVGPDLEWGFIDGSVVKAHQHSSGAPKNQPAAIGKSVVGNSSKIHLVVDSFGLPILFEVTEGQVHDSKMAVELLKNSPINDFVVADKGYDSEEIRNKIKENGSISVIPRRKNSIIGNKSIDWHIYKLRHLVENAFARLKHFRAIATRFDKLKRNYEGALAAVCAYIWLPL